MNRIVLPGPLWLASDLHLSSSTPATAEAFCSFLQLAASEAASLALPGDIFEVWIGDDMISPAPAWLADILQALKACAARIPVWLGRGNRDFLMGEGLATAAGVRLLPESALIETAYGLIMLSHGDEYCTDDTAYQQFRAMVRQPQWQAQFLALPIPERLKMVRQARDLSQAANQVKSMEIMDVNPEAVQAAFKNAGVSVMIHGHTHRPARHVLNVDGRKCERWVLPDWDCDQASPARGGWLVVDADGLESYDLEPKELKN